MMNSLGGVTTIGKLIVVVRRLPRGSLACVSPSLPLLLDDPCLIISSDDLADHEDVSSEAASLGFHMAIGRRTVMSVLDNLEHQRSDATLDESLAALNHYLETDAFIDIGVEVATDDQRC